MKKAFPKGLLLLWTQTPSPPPAPFDGTKSVQFDLCNVGLLIVAVCCLGIKQLYLRGKVLVPVKYGKSRYVKHRGASYKPLERPLWRVPPVSTIQYVSRFLHVCVPALT